MRENNNNYIKLHQFKNKLKIVLKKHKSIDKSGLFGYNKAIKRTEEKRNELQEQFTYQLQKSKQRRYGPPKHLI